MTMEHINDTLKNKDFGSSPRRHVSRYLGEPETRDHKTQGVARLWVEKKAIRYLRKKYPLDTRGLNRKLRTLLVIYFVFCEVTSNQEKTEFQVTYKTIAKMTGVSYSTVQRYADALIRLKLLAKENIKSGKANQANKWHLLGYNPMIHAINSSGQDG